MILLWNGYDYDMNYMKRIEEEILAPAYGIHAPRYLNRDWEKCFNDTMIGIILLIYWISIILICISYVLATYIKLILNYMYHINMHFLYTYYPYQTYILGKNSFTKLQYWYGSNKHQGTMDIITNRIMSTSVVVEKSMEEQEVIYQKLMNILHSSDELKQAKQTNEYEINYITEVAWVYNKKE